MTVPTKGRCASGKRRYETRVDALLVVARARGTALRNAHTRRAEQRAYRCPDCRGWHTTSQAKARR